MESLVSDPTSLSLFATDATADVPRGALAAHAALQSVLGHVTGLYCDDQEAGILATLLADAEHDGGLREAATASLRRFARAFARPGFTDDDTGRAAALLVLGALRANPALASQRTLLDAPCVRDRARATSLREEVEARLGDEPALAVVGASLPSTLRAPAAAAPASLTGQVRWILEAWDALLTDDLRLQLLRALDLLTEEEAIRAGGPGPAEVLDFGGPGAGAGDPRFSEDRAWMPNCVLLAKQALVWLDQLSGRFGRPIATLDQVPDEALDEIAARGFTGLWLIGLWERSDASREIKRRMGNPEAEASAYALKDYAIAGRLGGEDAYWNLKGRAEARGIRLAADMVPNHVGIDGRWVVEHPEWFVHSKHPPFEGYTFDGPDLSSDPRVSIHLEDGYWNRTDAAVTFKRYDHGTGETSFVYHGNDGTQMPWNDTAQIDFLNPDARAAVMDTILDVARRASIIRFDAAMTLAKRHVQRLWHPAPGSGGAIPSRSERAASPEAFDAAMPREFWVEVVERIAQEAPDTLLLAEAFWMMEGTFVRDFGMHRVYNSAFMHMLRDEDNAGYRRSIKNVLETSPAILERFVNFMNNPDEETAVEQFGKGDKYFGICTLMATMPGLPMFGHGQVEGFAEKYGMEFARAYAGEAADDGFVAHHEQVIFPLLRDRARFASAEQFRLYDFVTADGSVDENVFAYSNRGPAGERSLIVYNNRFERTSGRVRLDPNLELSGADGVLYGLCDTRTGLWYLRSGADLAESGLWIGLDGYGCHTFLGFREITDHDGSWTELMAELWGHGVPDLDEARREMKKRHAAASKAALEGPVEIADDPTLPVAAPIFDLTPAPTIDL